MMGKITKEIFLSSISCPTLGWTISHTMTPYIPLSLYEKFKIEEGLEVHKKARTLFTDGVLITGDNITAAKTTKKLLKDTNTTAIFEATFIADDFITKVDILVPQNNGWKIIEVKSAVNDDEKYIDDLAYTTMVAQKAGLKIDTCSLMFISRDYRLGMSDENLFTEIDHTDEVFEKVAEFKVCCDEVVKVVKSDTKPNFEIVWDCRNCDYFKISCAKGIQDYIFDLPRINYTKFCQLKELGVVKIEDIPDDFKLTDNQVKVKEAVESGEAVIDKEGLKEAVDSIVYPAYFLDFETVQTAIPLYKEVAPYVQIPTQYSLHRCSQTGDVDHYEYLADPKEDCRRELAERLITDCGSEGSIFSYSSFEKTIIKGLSELFPDLKKDLGGLLDRLVDLCDIIKKNYYHPDFGGSYSIKDVLPVLVPELSYDEMEISDGRDAIAVFAYMAMGRYSEEEESRIRERLLEYCSLDSWGMVKLERELRGKVKK